ncbi:hypothetical protein SDC9_181444 [bioreactor metagenome]|uniref:Uncharacterized protein n=1 Tax=bioreactor metagenome TaxID=1076179 RepID=A0A645H6I1_9ZZZZ
MPKAHEDTCGEQLLYACDAAANRLLVQTSLQQKVGHGVGDEANLRLCAFFNDIVGIVVVICREGAGVPRGNAPDPAALERFVSNHLQRAVKRIVRLVHVHIDVRIVFFRNVKANAYMFPAVVGRILISRHAADHVRARFHSLPHQRFTTGILQDALLREGDKLQVHHVAIFFAQRFYALQRL